MLVAFPFEPSKHEYYIYAGCGAVVDMVSGLDPSGARVVRYTIIEYPMTIIAISVPYLICTVEAVVYYTCAVIQILP